MGTRETTLLFNARDNVSPAINSMRASGQAYNKELEETQSKMAALQTKQSTLGDSYKRLQVGVDAAKNTLQAAKKEFKDMNDEASRTNLENAYGEYNKAREELREYGDEMKRVQRSMRELADESSRMENRAGGSGGAAGLDGTLSALSQAGLTKMLGSSISNAASVMIGSAFGDAMGGAINTAMDSTISGLSMGMMMGNPVLGGAMGLASGLINAATEVFAKEDEAFIAVRNEMVEEALQDQAETLSYGTQIARTREVNLRVFENLLDDDDTADEFHNKMIEIGRTPPFSYDTAVGLSRDMLGLGISPHEVEEKIEQLAEAAAALNLSGSEVSTIVSQLETVQLSGKVETRTMRTLSRMGINAYEALAKEYGVDESEVADLLSSIDAEDFVATIYDYMGAKFSGAADAMTNTYAGLVGIVESYEEDLQAAMGEGYNETRMIGMQDQMEYLSGEGGEQLQEANRLIGEWKGSLENNRERMEREIMSAVMSGDTSLLSEDLFDQTQFQRIAELAEEYLNIDETAEDAGARAGKVLAQAQIEAQMAYNASEGYQLEVTMQETLIKDVTSALMSNRSYWDAGYRLGQQMSEGMMSALREADWESTAQYISSQGWFDHLDNETFGPQVGVDPLLTYAYGLPSVPYDNYPAMLHQGEMVLTAAQAREYGAMNSTPSRAMGIPIVPYDDYLIRAHQGERLLTAAEARNQSQPVQVTISGNNFTIREEADVYKVGQELMEQLRTARLIAKD